MSSLLPVGLLPSMDAGSLTYVNEGRYGTVWKVFDQKLNRDVAIKKIDDFAHREDVAAAAQQLELALAKSDLPHLEDEINKLQSDVVKERLAAERYLRMICREVEALLTFSPHEEFVDVLGIYSDPSEKDLYVVMPWFPATLRSVVADHPAGLSEAAVRNVAFRLLKGVHRMSESALVHRDMSLSNVLCIGPAEVSVDSSEWAASDCVITDFGLSRCLTEESPPTKQLVTLPYRPPEMLLEVNYKDTASKVDVWSVGMMLVELLIGRPFLHGKEERDQFFLIVEHLCGQVESVQGSLHEMASPHVLSNLFRHPRWSRLASAQTKATDSPTTLRRLLEQRGVSKEGVTLIEGILRFSPTERLSAKDALISDWFSGLLGQGEAKPSLQMEAPARGHDPFDTLPASDMQTYVLEATAGARSTTTAWAVYTGSLHRRKAVAAIPLSPCGPAHDGEC